MKRRSRPLLVILAMTAGLLGLAYATRGEYARWAADHWRGQLDTVPDDRADLLLRQAAALGEPGTVVLVEALGSDRPTVSAESKRILDEQIHQWQTMDAAQRSARLTTLARALAAKAHRFGPRAKHDAAILARRILDVPLDPGAGDGRRIVGLCERVLHATGQARATQPADTPNSPVDMSDSWYSGATAGSPSSALRSPQGNTAGQASSGVLFHPATVGSTDTARLGNSLVGLSYLPGGGLPVEQTIQPSPLVTPTPVTASSVAPEPVAGNAPVEPPRRLTEPIAARLIEAQSEPAAFATTPFGDSVRSVEPNRAVTLSLNVHEQGARVPAVELPTVDSVVSGNLSTTDTVRLMQHLRSPDARAVSEARAELSRRGFTEVHFEMARRLFDPNPEVRRRLARTLPAMTSIDAAPWMLWLSHDPDPEVRLVAVGLIATSGDAALQQQVEQAAREDIDPRIRRQAEQMAARRDGAMR